MPIEDADNQDNDTQDGDATTATATPPAPVINEDRIVQKLFDRFQSATARPANTQEQSAIVKNYQAMKTAGMDDDFIALQLGITQNIKNDVVKEVQSQQAAMLRHDRDQKAYNVIGRCIREYGREDPRISKLEPVIRQAVVDKFNGSDARQAEWSRLVVNEDAIEKIVDDVVGDVSKNILGIDRPKAGPAVKTKTASTRTEADGDESGSGTGKPGTGSQVDESVLNEDQLEYYNTRVSNLQRWSGKTRVEAEKIAFTAAKALPKYNPRAFR